MVKRRAALEDPAVGADPKGGAQALRHMVCAGKPEPFQRPATPKLQTKPRARSPKGFGLGLGPWFRRRRQLLAAPPITPFDGGEVDHPTTDEHKQQGCEDGQHVVEREAGNNNVAHAQKLMVPSPLRPQTTMAIEKVKTAQRAAQPAVINMMLLQLWQECSQRRGAD